MNIRKAESKDIGRIEELLSEVLEIHARIRPDIFIPGTTKYTPAELEEIIKNESTPVFVAEDLSGTVVGYAFCIIKSQPFSTNMKNFKTLFIDDLCVDENCRGRHVGKSLWNFVLDYAKTQNCYDITLNVWEGNTTARTFYEKIGMSVKETQMEYIIK